MHINPFQVHDDVKKILGQNDTCKLIQIKRIRSFKKHG